MASAKSRKDFPNTEEGKEVKTQLQQMVESNTYNTCSSYSANTSLYPDNLIPFVDKHMEYLINHPMIEANQYLSNIKLMTRTV